MKTQTTTTTATAQHSAIHLVDYYYMSNLVRIIRSTKHTVNWMAESVCKGAGGGGNDGAGPRNVNNFARIAIELGCMNVNAILSCC